jgi:succinate-semialdehyde dehydrogenase/glutarate-semialdehyde dehydrogenase
MSSIVSVNPWTGEELARFASDDRARVQTALSRAADVDEAVMLANCTEYGLAATLWTRGVDRARRLARRIDAGAVFINSVAASSPELPFGRIKRSGYGRELGSFGVREFVNVKTACIGDR